MSADIDTKTGFLYGAKAYLTCRLEKLLFIRFPLAPDIAFFYAGGVMLKSALRSTIGSFVISLLLAAMMALLVGLRRWHQQGHKALRTRMKAQPQIIIFWHEHLFVMSPLLPSGCSALQSPHPDGRVLAGASRLFGLRPIWGSSNRKAASGLRQLVSEIKSGRSVVITPDGPRGPRRALSMGPVSLSQLTGAPITLAAWSGNRLWRAPSWDKMRFPKPLGRANLIYSDAIMLEKTKDKNALEAQRQMLEDKLNALVEACDNAQTGQK